MDPATLAVFAAALGAGLFKALETLANKAIVEPTLKPLSEFLEGKYNKKKAEASLLAAVKLALATATGSPDQKEWARFRWVTALESLKANPGLAARAAAAAVEMVGDDPARVPPDLAKDINLSSDQHAPFAAFLFKLRQELVKIEGYGAGIQYANELHALNPLDGLYELVAGVVGEAGGQKFVWVRPLPPDQRALERPYLEFLLEELHAPAMESRAKDKTLGEPLRLERVYVALNTTEGRALRPAPEDEPSPEALRSLLRDRETPPLSALKAVMSTRRLVLLGDPGSGKSTFAQHLCLCLAGARLGAMEEWLDRLRADDLDHWQLPPLFPLFARLRRFAADFASLPDDSDEGQAHHLLAHIKKGLVENGWPALADHAQTLLENGEALLVLDGLDEVTHPKPTEGLTPEVAAQRDAARRAKVAQAIEHISRVRCFRARVRVTCRVRQYPLDVEGRPTAPWALPRFAISALADFSWEQAQTFTHDWFAELHARGREPDPAGQTRTLLASLAAHPKLRELAYKPILLTQMAYVHALDRLPDSRVEVYTECAKLLLWDWETLRAKQSKSSLSAEDFLAKLNVPGLTPEEARKALDEAVFHAHSHGDPEVPGERLRHALRQTFAGHGLPEADRDARARQFISGWLRGSNGLLIPAGEDTFDTPHRSFREFMAGRYLQENRVPDPDTGRRERWDVTGPHLAMADPDKWREIFRFAAGLDESPDEVADALNRLCPTRLDPAAALPLLLAAEVVLDVGKAVLLHPRNEVGQQVYRRLERQLLHLMRNTAEGDYPNDPPRLTPPDVLLPKTRLDAGLLLDALDWTPPDLDEFV